ncbi:MAG TPA: hypothetical protein VH877_30320 [Polyangia bacterium]|nr:hypothetical protein [Polyangia bacterium]
MRLVAVIAGLSLLVGGWARAAVTLAEFTAPEKLAIFAPEVSHALHSALERAGFDVTIAAPGSASTLVGKIEPLGPERVRLAVQVEGRAVMVEGELERIDELVTALAEKLKEVLPANLRRPGTAAVAPEQGRSTRVTPPPPSERSEQGAVTLTSTQNSRGSGVGHQAVKKETTVPLPAVAVGSSATRTGPGAPASRTPASGAGGGERRGGEPQVETPPVRPEAPGEVHADESHPSEGERRQPTDSPPPDRAPPLAQAQPPHRSRAESGVVLHYVGLPTGCQASLWATIAARTFLEHYLHAQVVPSGACGYQPLSQAVVEGARAGARSVLMMWFDQLDLSPSGVGYRVNGSLRIMMVQDGRLVYHRQLPVGPRLMSVPDVARASSDLVTIALRAVGYELQRLLDNGHQGTAAP